MAVGLLIGASNLCAERVELQQFLEVLVPTLRERALERLEANWTDGLAAPLIEINTLTNDSHLNRSILDLLARQTGQRHGLDSDEQLRWLWETSPALPQWYGDFKAAMYSAIDVRFAEYFDNNPQTTVRLDEIRWGGVLRDGIPPLDHPRLIPADEADYLAPSDVIFGVEQNGEARAYPKRILAWHEMVRDRIGGEEFNGVYCTLCGSMILYRATVNGTHHVLGTSGFLYRSNKLMYDRATKSLWSTINGEPVVGPLVGRGIKLEPLHVVTTTWAEWRRRHPGTRVLSLQTGLRRDYSEGAAYRDYFATDRLMFIVPGSDRRLRNKDEVLALRFGSDDARPTAISEEFLARHPIHQGMHDGVEFVVLTDESGANRVYAAHGVTFSQLTPDAVESTDGRRWQITEAALVSARGEKRDRLPAHRAFWFGWQAAHPDTLLVK